MEKYNLYSLTKHHTTLKVLLGNTIHCSDDGLYPTEQLMFPALYKVSMEATFVQRSLRSGTGVIVKPEEKAAKSVSKSADGRDFIEGSQRRVDGFKTRRSL